MKNNYIYLYNNLIKLSTNKDLYKNFNRQDTFSDRLVIFLLHFSFILKNFKNKSNSIILQEIYDFNFRQLELSIREIGYGDATVNKKMKDYVNLFYSILEKIEKWDYLEKSEKINLIADLMNIYKDNDLIVNYLDKYKDFLSKNPLKKFSKDIIELKF